MHGNPSPLTERKRLLLAQSQMNRSAFGREWDSFCDEATNLAHEARKLGSLASTGAAMFASGAALRRLLFKRNGRRTSWMGTLINGARAGFSIWLALRQRVR